MFSILIFNYVYYVNKVPLPEDNAKASIDTRQHTKAQCTDIKKDGEKPLQELEEKKDKVAKPKKGKLITVFQKKNKYILYCVMCYEVS